MNETYSAWIRGRLPKYEKPKCEFIDNLNPFVIVDQSRLGGNARSTVGTISEMYSSLRLFFPRIGEPKIDPDGGTSGEEIVFTGTPQEMIDHADTITAKYLRKA